jgi:glycosyltransferase involved in cell wall biosynthesis
MKRPLRLLVYINFFLHWVALPVIFVVCVIGRLCVKKTDIGMGPAPMINNVYWARALRRKGYSVETFVNRPFSITEDFDLLFNKGWRQIFRVCPALSFLRCVFKYKIMYVYFNGGPLYAIPGLRGLEPKLFRLAGVKTVVMPYGSDCQIFQRTQNKLMVNALCKDYPAFFQKQQQRVSRQVDSWSRTADIVVGAMDSIDFLYYWNRIRLCHYAIDTDAYQPQYPAVTKKDVIKILHAPNHKAVKGTDAIFKAIDDLKSEGYPIELIFKQGVPNAEFLEIVRQADIVIDQLIMGMYAMFSMEAMSFGKPVICYMREDLIDTFVNAGCVERNDIPFVSARPENIKDVLRSLLDKPEQLAELGMKSRAYVVKYHSLEVVGDFFDEINRSLGVSPNEVESSRDYVKFCD